MADKPDIYSINPSALEPWLQATVKRRKNAIVVILAVVSVWVAGLTYAASKDIFPTVMTFVFGSSVSFLAMRYGIADFKRRLATFQTATYSITEEGVEMRINQDINRHIPFSKIAVMDKRSFGILMVKGGTLTKLDYFRPKKASLPIDHSEVIFIPRAVSGYEELVNEIKRRRQEHRNA